MPLASILAAIGGAILIFWRYLVAFYHKIFGISDEEETETAVVDESVSNIAESSENKS
ncbi:MAG: hypothetical protein GY796_31835 [Chloroflexi bacterium]|nr:hypothetical protein [Chloroflexota bacterium]